MVNKSHAAAYAYIAFYTAWLKLNYPVEYMTALLNYTPMDKLPMMITECRENGIEVLPPNVNESGIGFTYRDGKILFGLDKIKGIGKSVDDLIAIRNGNQFHSFKDFIMRGHLKKNVTEAMIDCGALDMWCKNRNAMKLVLEPLAKDAKRIKEKEGLVRVESDEKKRSAAKNKLESYRERFEFTPIPVGIPEDRLERLSKELELLGMYVSGHPLDEYEDVRKKRSCPIAEAADGKQELCGAISSVHITKRKSDGAPMAFFRLEDESGSMKVICFAKAYERIGSLIREGAVVQVQGQCMTQEDDDENIYVLFANNIIPIERTLKRVCISVPDLAIWSDEVYPVIRANYQGDAFELFVHDKMLSEVRKTNLKVSAAIMTAEIPETDVVLFQTTV